MTKREQATQPAPFPSLIVAEGVRRCQPLVSILERNLTVNRHNED